MVSIKCREHFLSWDASQASEEVAAEVEAPVEAARPAAEPLVRNGAKVLLDVDLVEKSC